MNLLLAIYRFLFVRRRLYRLNRAIYLISLRGIGALNYENRQISGERTFLTRLSRHRRALLVLDVGANVGQYSELIRSVNNDATIVAFEPNPTSFRALEQNSRLLRISVERLAVGDSPGELALFENEHAPGSEHASLYRSVLEDIHGASVKSALVHVTTVDQYLDEHGIKSVGLLKIDTEGNELNVIRGAKRAIDEGRIEVIHFEFNEMNVISRAFLRDFWNLLNGYRIYRMFPDGLLHIADYNAISCEIFAFQNYVAVHAKSDLNSLL